MKPITSALDQILSSAQPIIDDEVVPLISATGRVLASPIIATIDVPPTPNSAMDGYALSSGDLQPQGSWLPVSQRIPAGHPALALAAGTAARIFTGASIPPGADAVVMQENCQTREGDVFIPGPVIQGNNIRPQGQDIAKGSQILAPGKVLQPQDLGLIASLGLASVRVKRKLRVAIISTGDELCEPGQPAAPHQIYNSNRYQLAGFLAQMNLERVDIGFIADTPAATASALAKAAQSADCIITTGGVSVGEEDHVKAAIEQHGQLNLWKLAIKPGKPLAFGHYAGTPIFGLPGNPVAVFVTFLLLVRPFLYRLQGTDAPDMNILQLPASFERSTTSIRQEYVRVKITADGVMQTFPNQSSGALSSASWANALAVVKADTIVRPGDLLPVILLNTLFY